MCQHASSVAGVHWNGCPFHVPACGQCGGWNMCAFHVPACWQCGGCALERVCLSCASMWALWQVCAGACVLVMCQHVGSAVGVRWNVCAYHVPACGQCGGCALERVCLSCAGCALERVCLSCASMWAVWRVCTGTGVLIMCQHVGSVAGVRWNMCAYHVPACGQCGGRALERVCLSCASMCPLLLPLV